MTYAKMNGGARGQAKTDIEYCYGHRSCDWCSFGAVAGLTGGIITVLFGSALTALSWFEGQGSHLEKLLGTVLLLMTIPLLIVGAECLDLLDKRKDRAREARFNQQK